MITGDGVACLADFAVSGFVADPTVEESGMMAASKRRLLCYMAPEQIRPSNFDRTSGEASKESDVHWFAMTAYEVRSPASPMKISEEFTPQLAPHEDPAVHRQQTPQPDHQTHLRRRPSASAIAGDRGPVVTRFNLGNDRILLGLKSMGAIGDYRSP